MERGNRKVNPVIKQFKLGKHTVTLETGRIARQASGAVFVTVDDTVVLVSVVGKKEANPNQSFFPLTVNYIEKNYAAGKIPGGYKKREGPPSEHETLTCRLIDRPIRPLFPEGFMNEVQVIATVMSLNVDVQADMVAMIGVSAALAISGIPFAGPIGGVRVGYVNNEYVLNPSPTELEESALELVVAGTEKAVLMVESEAQELSESVMLGAVMFGHDQLQTIIGAVKEFAAESAKPTWDWSAPVKNEELIAAITAEANAAVTEAYQIADKLKRQDKVAEIRDQVVAKLAADDADKASEVKELYHDLERKIVRERVVSGEPRIDGRDHDMIRAIAVEVGVLPRTHGSALFTRGETQAIVSTTLGTARDAQMVDALTGKYDDHFMLHYNFPPYSVGEAGFMGNPKRREIGHGKLARRGIAAVLPALEDFSYTVRVVSEITESNGSSSMASVCGTSLALMDAGVPIKAPVAGIAMGLIKEGDKHVVLSDILGDEDHLGDMDFKVAGTEEGVTALQMDIKIDGITQNIMEQALAQAKGARLHILGVMNQAIADPRDDVSEHAPRITTIKINPDKIRDVIGKGGATIRSITEETGASIDIDDDGTIKVGAVDSEAAAAAVKRIEDITKDLEPGQIYDGKVARIVDFGAFVTIAPGKDGLVHISQIAEERVNKVSDYLKEGQEVKVKLIEIDRQGRVRLSMKEVNPPAADTATKDAETAPDSE